MSVAISAPRRLSSESTRKPLNGMIYCTDDGGKGNGLANAEGQERPKDGSAGLKIQR
jgi:hypothetical protein